MAVRRPTPPTIHFTQWGPQARAPAIHFTQWGPQAGAVVHVPGLSGAAQTNQAQAGNYPGAGPNGGAPSAEPPPGHVPVAPFHTPGENMTFADAMNAHNTRLQSIDSGLENLRINTEYQKAGNLRDLGRNQSNTVDAMIARGLYQSSIKDGAMADLQAESTRRQNFLQTTLDTAGIQANAAKLTENGAWDTWNKAFNAQAVENAQNVPVAPQPDQPQAPTAPSTGAAAPAGKPAPGFSGVISGLYVAPGLWDPGGFWKVPYGAASKGGFMHVYQDGHRVFVP